MTIAGLSAASGVSRPTIWRIEHDRTLPLTSTIGALAVALDCHPWDLVAEELRR